MAKSTVKTHPQECVSIDGQPFQFQAADSQAPLEAVFLTDTGEVLSIESLNSTQLDSGQSPQVIVCEASTVPEKAKPKYPMLKHVKLQPKGQTMYDWEEGSNEVHESTEQCSPMQQDESKVVTTSAALDASMNASNLCQYSSIASAVDQVVKMEAQDERVAAIMAECSTMDDTSLLSLSSQLFLQTARKRSKKFVNFIGQDFITSCLEATEILNSSSKANVLSLLAKYLSNELLHTESVSFRFLEIMLLAIENNVNMDTPAFRDFLARFGKHCNQSTVDFANEVLFPNQDMGFSLEMKDGKASVKCEMYSKLDLSENEATEAVHEEEPDWKEDSEIEDHEADTSITQVETYSCNLCGTKFTSEMDAKHHEDTFVCLSCPVCQNVLDTRAEWKAHLETHSVSDPFVCSFCGKPFKKKENLLRHQKTVHELIKAFSCETCGKSFTERNSLRDHVRIHTGERPFPCYLCTEQMRTRGLFTRHMSVVHKIPVKDIVYPQQKAQQVECPTCKKIFKRSSALEKHVKAVHSAVKEHSCVTCGKLFTEKSGLAEHMRLHTGEKPFECDLCGKKFRTRGLFSHHADYIHKGQMKSCSVVLPVPEEAAHYCNLCSKDFKRKDNLLRHMQKVHENPKQHQCSQCAACFRDNDALEEHVRLHRGEKPFLCTKCPESFHTREEHRKHTATSHGFVCEICDMKFKSAALLGQHHRGHKELQSSSQQNTRFNCMQCSKSFHFRYQRERHFQLVHRGIKRFQCKVCGKRTNNLSEHMATHDRQVRFSCGTCGEGFIHRASYKRHVVRHTGLQQFPCPLCDKRFDTPDYVRNHVTRIHRNIDIQLKFVMPGAALLEHMKGKKGGGRKSKGGSFGIFPSSQTLQNTGESEREVTKQEDGEAHNTEETLQQDIPMQDVNPTDTSQQFQYMTPHTGYTPLVDHQYQSMEVCKTEDPEVHGSVSSTQLLHVASQDDATAAAVVMDSDTTQVDHNVQILQLDESGRVVNVPPASMNFIQME